MPMKLIHFVRSRFLTVAVITLILLIFALAALPAVLSSSRLPLGVRVNGVSLGLKTFTEAEEILSAEWNDILSQEVELHVSGETTSFVPAKAGIRADTSATVNNIRSRIYGDSGWKKYLYLIKNFYFKTEYPVFLGYDDTSLTAFIEKFNSVYGEKPEEATLSFDVEGNPVIEEGKAGSGITADYFISKLEDYFNNREKAILLELQTIQPVVSNDDVEYLLENVVPAWKIKQLVLKYGEHEESYSGPSLLYLFKADPESDIPKLTVYDEKLENLLSAQFPEIYVEPQDAGFRIEGKKVTILPHKNGQMPDVTRTAGLIMEELSQADRAEITIPTVSIEPSLTAEKARSYGIREEISSFTTYYDASQYARVTNIKLLAQILDGMLIPPGETFSFNEWIGPRTLERGFKLAPTIINGRLVDTAGGGACQVATTLFNTAFFAGVDIVERHNHSFFISHYPAGRDATVSYGGYDLKFKNDYKNWILIKAWATSSRITIAFYSTSEGRDVKYSTYGPFNFKPFKIEYVDDPELEEGKEEIEDKGIQGRTYRVVRQVYDAEGKLLHEDTFVSVYRPKVQVVRRGTKKVTTETAVPES